MALEAVLGERFRRESPTELSVDMSHGEDSLVLNVVFDTHSPYPSAQYPTRPPAFFLTSTTLPSYMRLHLHASMLSAFRDPERHDLVSVLEAGTGGAILSMVEHLEMSLPDVIDNPPDIGLVTRHLVPRVEDDADEPIAKVAAQGQRKQQRGSTKRRVPTEAEQEATRNKQARLFADPAYESMMQVRRKLPAWAERDNICQALETSRVLVVVGEVRAFALATLTFADWLWKEVWSSLTFVIPQRY